ncbi:MAG TPA: glycosyltransferase, partial [Flavisolibacter sp.]
LGTTIVLKPEDYQVNKSFPLKVLDYFSYKRRMKRVRSEAKKADLVFSNTIANGRLMKELSVHGKPMVVYVHELESAMEFCNRHHDTELSLQLATILFSPAGAVTRNMIQHHHVDPAVVFPLNYYFPLPELMSLDKEKARSIFSEKYQIPPASFHVVGMGAANLRKGIDLFTEVCKLVISKDPGVHFTWIGGFLEEDLELKTREEIRNYGMESNLTITGYIPHAYENLLPFDLLALTSREDPYPLVVLEAAFMNIPSIAFAGTGGMEDFISHDAGFLLPQVSAEAMANKILELKEKKEWIQSVGKKAREKAIQLHTDEKLVMEQLRSGLQAIINQ